MSLDVAKLEKVRELPGGIVQSRCPACAEGGHDRTGEHLRIYADGRFGCCVHPKDGEHRKRIWSLVGRKSSHGATGTFTLRIKTPPAMSSVRSVKAALIAGTLGTGKTESETGVAITSRLAVGDSGTPGTGHFKSRAYAREDLPTAKEIYGEKLKDLEIPVPSVPSLGLSPSPMSADQRLPFLTAGGSLSIPFDSPERYHWWKPDGVRMTIDQIMNELKERMIHAIAV